MTDQLPPQLPAVHEAWLPREHALHRPRHGGKQLTALICALVFFLTPNLLWLTGARPGEIENHKLAGFPGLSSGWGFFTGLPQWATDQLIFRSGAIEAADGVSRGLFGEPAPLDQGTPDSGPLPGSPPTSGDGEQDQPGTTVEPGFRRVIEGKDGWLYYGYDTDAKCEPARPFAETLRRIDRLRKAVEDSGRRFVLAIAPDKTTMVPQYLPDDYAGKDCARPATEEFWKDVDAEVDAVDLRPRLTALQQELGQPAYFSNDTHWTDEGGIELTKALAEQVRPGITSTWRTASEDTVDVPADLPTMQGRSGDKHVKRYQLRPDGSTDRTGFQVSGLTSPTHSTAPPMDATVNDRTLVFGDSFTAASSRYLPAGFSDLTILGYSTLGEREQQAIDEFVKADVVVLEVVERSAAGGNLPFVEDGFLGRVGEAMAAQPR